jgi:hypothetical protein
MRFYISRDRALGAILGLELGLLALSVLVLVMRGTAIYFVVITVGLIIVVPVGTEACRGMETTTTQPADAPSGCSSTLANRSLSTFWDSVLAT